jgi:hypothetical protein
MSNVDTDIVSEETHQKFEGSTMSKAGRLAMELAQEKRRLAEELAELQMEAEELRPTTPTGTVDYYAKWGATVLAILGVFMMQANLNMFGQVAYFAASCAWVYVGSVWNDRAIMIGSAITATAVAMNLVGQFV